MSVAKHLIPALMALAGGKAALVRSSERPWASVTFSGSRHEIELRFVGEEAVAAGEHFIDALPEHEFILPGHLVADASVNMVDHRLLRGPSMRMIADIVVLEAA